MAVPFAICEKPLLRVLKDNLYRLIAHGRINEFLGRRVAASTDHRSDINQRTISTRLAQSSRNLDRTELNCVHGVGPLFSERKTLRVLDALAAAIARKKSGILIIK